MGVLVMLIGITLVTVGCDQANKAGDNTGNSGNTGNAGNGGNNTANGITGVWKVTKFAEKTYPQPIDFDPEAPAEARQQMYVCITTDGKYIQVMEITGYPEEKKQMNGLYKEKKGTYKLLPGDKLELDLGGGPSAVSYVISGNTLTLQEMKIEAVKVTSPTEAQIKALP